MAAPEDLREELLSVIAAAPELDPADRVHLADVFLEKLEKEYRVVPRSHPAPSGYRAPPPRSPRRRLSIWPLIPVVLGLFLLFSIVSGSMFMPFHPPILLFVILIVLAVRSRSWGHRRRMYP